MTTKNKTAEEVQSAEIDFRKALYGALTEFTTRTGLVVSFINYDTIIKYGLDLDPETIDYGNISLSIKTGAK